MPAYYNEIDPYAAQWLRNLIAAGHIAPGIVDERSIEDVLPSELSGFTQCHFFAGIGVWSLALRGAGWPDDRPVWTGSCPCQPFSQAGQGAGFDDERHLWPAFFHLIQECRPAIVFGEQVASSNVDPWLDLVQSDLEALGHTFGCVAFPSAGVGAPHIRDRAYWVGLSHGVRAGRNGRAVSGALQGQDRQQVPVDAVTPGGIRGLELADAQRWGGRQTAAPGNINDGEAPKRSQDHDGSGVSGAHRLPEDGAGPTNGLWRAADWLLCRDGLWRPVEPGTFPLAHGAPARVGRLRGYGNAINAEAARVFIEAVMAA